jgi:hypothetical protein
LRDKVSRSGGKRRCLTVIDFRDQIEHVERDGIKVAPSVLFSGKWIERERL